MQGNEPSPYNPGAKIEGTSVLVLFSWNAVAELQRLHGKRECFQKLATVLSERDVIGISEIAEIAVPGHTAESFRALSLPMNQTVEAMQDAWLIFLNGADKVAADKESETGANPPKAQSTLFASLLKLVSKRGSPGPTSGNSLPSKLN